MGEVRQELIDFFSSEEGEKLIGEIVLKAVNFGLTVEMDIQEFDKGKMEKVVKTKRVNVLHFLAKYLPQIEGRLLGVQEDANKTYNTIGRIARQVQSKRTSLLPWRR
jgi:hypothetical protein